MLTPRIRDFVESSFHAKSFCEGVPGYVKSDKAGGEKAVKDASEGFAYMLQDRSIEAWFDRDNTG